MVPDEGDAPGGALEGEVNGLARDQRGEDGGGCEFGSYSAGDKGETGDGGFGGADLDQQAGGGVPAGFDVGEEAEVQGGGISDGDEARVGVGLLGIVLGPLPVSHGGRGEGGEQEGQQDSATDEIGHGSLFANSGSAPHLGGARHCAG